MVDFPSTIEIHALRGAIDHVIYSQYINLQAESFGIL